jgi:TatD DNase family protein
MLANASGAYKMIGETGLDYYWLKQDLKLENKAKLKSIALQKLLFREQLRLAVKYNITATIHVRDLPTEKNIDNTTDPEPLLAAAFSDALEIINEFNGKVKAIFHSYTGDLATARDLLSQGFGLGFNGIVTYKSATALREILKNLTADKKITNCNDLYKLNLYLETDSPFLIPSNLKIRPPFNTPSSIKVIWDYVYNLLEQK